MTFSSLGNLSIAKHDDNAFNINTVDDEFYREIDNNADILEWLEGLLIADTAYELEVNNEILDAVPSDRENLLH